MNTEQSPAGTIPRSEAEMVSSMQIHLSASFGEGYLFATEVRSHGSARTDVVLLATSELIGIEVKLVDWKRALAQAALNRFCVDRSYVALWATLVTESLVEEAARLGLGILSVTPTEVKIVLDAPLSSPSATIRERMAKQVLERAH